MNELSEAERLAIGPPEELARYLALDAAALRGLDYQWRFWARPEQLAPEGDWRHWLVLAGRGFGKTRAGAEWVRAQAETDGRLRIALVAATLHEARAVVLDQQSVQSCRPIRVSP